MGATFLLNAPQGPETVWDALPRPVQKRILDLDLRFFVIDATKVVRSALQNASSIAGLLLTTECLITEAPEKEKKAAGGGHDHHGMGGGMDF